MSSEIDEIEKLPVFRQFTCSKCKTQTQVHALEIYKKCSKCKLKHKCRAFGGIGTEIQDTIDAVLEWAGISREEVIKRHSKQYLNNG